VVKCAVYPPPGAVTSLFWPEPDAPVRLARGNISPEPVRYACLIVFVSFGAPVRAAPLQGGIENGRKVRMDCTVVDSAIHHPLDSALLYDVVRVLCRLMGRCSAYCDIEYSDRTRRAKRRSLEILNARKKAQRKKAYRDLLCVTREVLGFVDEAMPLLTLFAKEFNQDGAMVVCGLLPQLEHFASLGVKVVDQAERRVLGGESVPSGEKVVSIKDICFSKRRGIEITDMVKSAWVFKQLRRFRAGVEGCISFLKRCFGLDRCTWRGLGSFKSYIWSSVVSYNLLVMARHVLH